MSGGVRSDDGRQKRGSKPFRATNRSLSFSVYTVAGIAL